MCFCFFYVRFRWKSPSSTYTFVHSYHNTLYIYYKFDILCLSLSLSVRLLSPLLHDSIQVLFIFPACYIPISSSFFFSFSFHRIILYTFEFRRVTSLIRIETNFHCTTTCCLCNIVHCELKSNIYGDPFPASMNRIIRTLTAYFSYLDGDYSFWLISITSTYWIQRKTFSRELKSFGHLDFDLLYKINMIGNNSASTLKFRVQSFGVSGTANEILREWCEITFFVTFVQKP